MSNTANTVIGFLIVLVGLPITILLLRDYTRRASAMQYSKAQTAGLVIAYILGGFFVIMGSVNIRTEETSIHPIADCVLNVAFIIVGLLTWAATFFRYGGGFWSIVGVFLVVGAFAGTVSIVETHIRGWHYDSPVAFYIRIATCWIVGVVFLLMGHRRHRKKNQMLPNTNRVAPADSDYDRMRE
jgi:hypothetical protein